MDGKAVMEHLGIGGGPVIGRALEYLLDVKRAEGVLGPDEIRAKLDAWWAEQPESGH
jgi:poly(A) polymerase